MKKLILFLTIFAALSIQVAAQDVTIPKAGSNFDVTLDAGDTLSATALTLSKVIGVGSKLSVQLYSIQVTLDSISGTPAVSTVLAGSLDNSNYTTISTVAWAGTTSDTTFVITDVSTGVLWPYMRVRSTESGTAKSQLTRLVGRFVDEVR